ncbi:MAG TPA: cytochrome c peroxidase [Bacteroidia bacterium]|nr:cytochrome c peroxidase [Bacteroidia bacterium]
MKKIVALLFAFILVSGCQDAPPEIDYNELDRKANDELIAEANKYFQPLPLHQYQYDRSEIAQQIHLGKILYYDPRLSKYGTYSCNSCHNLSTSGVDNKATIASHSEAEIARNVPTVLNAIINNVSSWDGSFEATGNDDELAIPHADILSKKIEEIPEYQKLFAEAFPLQDTPLTLNNLEKSIVAFERTLITPSGFDKFLEGNAFAISYEARAGLKLFIQTGCTDCHSGSALGGTMVRKFGEAHDYHPLTGSSHKDEGLKNRTGNLKDKDKFKVAGLRNIGRTYPYFHDGSVEYLSTAVKIMAKTQLDKDLDDEQIRLIVTFLNALSGDVPEDAQKAPLSLASY